MDTFINKIYRASGMLGINNKRVIELLQASDEKSLNILRSYLGAAGFGARRANELIEGAKREIAGLPPVQMEKPHGTKAPNAMGYNPSSMTSKNLLRTDEPVPDTKPRSVAHDHVEPEVVEPIVEEKPVEKPVDIPEVWKKATELKTPKYEKNPEAWVAHAMNVKSELGSVAKTCKHLKVSRQTWYNRVKDTDTKD